MIRTVNVVFPATTEEVLKKVNNAAPGILLLANFPDTTTHEGALAWLKQHLSDNELRLNEFIVPSQTVLELSDGLWRATVIVETVWDAGNKLEYAVRFRESDKSYSIQQFPNLLKAKEMRDKYEGKILYREVGEAAWQEYYEIPPKANQ